MSRYTVKQLARLSGVSVRTLHHYDEIGLLKPASIGENRYRYYGREELLRLQDIMFHRELGVPLKDIARLLDTDEHNRIDMLQSHRAVLAERVKRSRQLLRTIDRAIAELNGEETMKDKDLYKGFSAEKQAAYEVELVERFGPDMVPILDTSRIAWERLDDAGKQSRMAEYGAVEAAMVAFMRTGEAPESMAAEPLLARHRAWVAAMWNANCSPKSYAGLGLMYTDHPDFRARFETIEPGFAEWLAAAMRAHARRHAVD